jgi:peroxiredoxin 2/4
MKSMFYFLSLMLLALIARCEVKPGNIATPQIGDNAPAFTAKTTNGNLVFPQDFGTSWKILFSHPKDFTPVCSTEIIQLASMQEDFEKLGVKVAVISTDSLQQHKSWKQALEEISYKGKRPVKIKFPIIADPNYSISLKYGMIHEKYNTSMDVRGVFIINPENKICAVFFYPTNIGRNLEEIKRTVTALQVAGQSCVLPVNWKPGEDVMVPHFPFTDAQLKEKPSLKNDYYNYGPFIWFRKTN